MVLEIAMVEIRPGGDAAAAPAHFPDKHRLIAAPRECRR